jgi:hypothetical protein
MERIWSLLMLHILSVCAPAVTVVREHALALARTSVDRDEAVRELEPLCGGRRVAVVRARQQVLSVRRGGGRRSTLTE